MPPAVPPASASSPSAGADAPAPAPAPAADEHAEETGDVSMADASPSLPGEERDERDRRRGSAMEHSRDASGPSHTVSTQADATSEAPSEASHAHVSSETPVQRSSSSETVAPTSVDAKTSTTTTTTTPTASAAASEPAVATTSAPAQDTRMHDKAEPAAASSRIATDTDSKTQESRPAAPGTETAPSSSSFVQCMVIQLYKNTRVNRSFFFPVRNYMLDRSGSEASFMRTRHGHRTHTNGAIVRHGFVCVMGSLQLAGVYIARALHSKKRKRNNSTQVRYICRFDYGNSWMM